jgi:hypothetical protein
LSIVFGVATTLILIGAVWALAKVVIAWNDVAHPQELTGSLRQRFGVTVLCGLVVAVAVVTFAIYLERRIPRLLLYVAVGTGFLVGIEVGALPFLRFVAPINNEAGHDAAGISPPFDALSNSSGGPKMNPTRCSQN